MPAFHLAPEIYFCASDGAYIFLDARADRYFAYTGETARLFPEIISTNRTELLSQDAERFAEHLLRIGVLLRPAAETRPLKACTAARPDTSRFDQACLLAADAKSSEWSNMLTALARSWSLKRTHSLRGVISYLTGQGGDHLFHAAETSLGLSDYLRRHGLGPDLISELTNSARLSKLSVWRVLRDTLPDMIGKTHTSSLLGAIAARRTPLNTAALDIFDPVYAFPDWARTPGGVPPGKFDQVSGILHMIQVQERLFAEDAREVVNPLMSQPLIELCLRLPVYLLSLAGVSRGLARKAFEGRLPDLVRLRMTKGEATRYFVDQLRLNLSMVRDCLMDGELVAHGIVQRRDVETFLREDQFLTHPAGRMILVYYAIEAWLRTWKTLRTSM